MSTLQIGLTPSLVASAQANSYGHRHQKFNFFKIIHTALRYAKSVTKTRNAVFSGGVFLNGIDQYTIEFLRAKLSEREEVFSDLYDLYNVYDDVNREVDIILRITENNFSINRFDLVNRTLEHAVTEYLSPLAIEGLLRATYRFKHVLPSWDGLLKRAEKTLDDSGIDVELVLSGLRK